MNVVIIGGGASGLTAAITALRAKKDVTILEQKPTVGKKLLATGNGRCNLTNLDMQGKYYNGTDLAKSVLVQVSPQTLIDFFDTLGIKCTSDSAGRVYPLTLSAADVVRCLQNEIKYLGGKIITDCKAEKIYLSGEKLCVCTSSGDYFADKVLLCSGGIAATNDYLQLVEEKYLVKQRAALAPLNTIPSFKAVDGLRIKCQVSLFCNQTKLATEQGEVLFRSYGLSGIAIFNLSSILQRNALNDKNVFHICLDLLPTFSLAELEQELAKRKKKWKNNFDNIFCGLLNAKLSKIVCKDTAQQHFDVKEVAFCLKNFSVKTFPQTDFSLAQITCGGVDTKYINTKMQFLPNPNIYICGELADVDGLCGGYNLHFAFASGIIAASNL